MRTMASRYLYLRTLHDLKSACVSILFDYNAGTVILAKVKIRCEGPYDIAGGYEISRTYTVPMAAETNL